ncbi:hypothetical protein KY320_03200 [Candidatus Woesearchaeota archaeon]|nr:hypothetical protein [Candidatus Woesearchaeota archaeon]
MMSFTQFAPVWFYGFDVAFELAFAVVSLIVAIFAFRIHKATDQRNVQLFGIAFLLVSVSYFVQSLFNFLMISKANENICQVLKIQSILLFNALGAYTHMIFMTLGLVVLTYMVLKTENKEALWLLSVVSLLSIFFASNRIYMFFLMSSVYLVFLTWHFVENYLHNRQTKTLLVAIAFLFLLFGSSHFLVAVNHQLFYVIGHILELVAYMFILWNFVLVRKK